MSIVGSFVSKKDDMQVSLLRFKRIPMLILVLLYCAQERGTAHTTSSVRTVVRVGACWSPATPAESSSCFGIPRLTSRCVAGATSPGCELTVLWPVVTFVVHSHQRVTVYKPPLVG